MRGGGGGARPNPEGGRNLKKWGKSTFFWKIFELGGGGGASCPLRPLPAYGPASEEVQRRTLDTGYVDFLGRDSRACTTQNGHNGGFSFLIFQPVETTGRFIILPTRKILFLPEEMRRNYARISFCLNKEILQN